MTEKLTRLSARPAQKNLGSDVTGLRETGLDSEHDGLLYVPESFDPKKASALVVILHGTGGNARHGIEPLKALADRTGTILLSPEAQESNWDLLKHGKFGSDVYFINEALIDIFALYRIDPKKIAVAGFSDGGAYALSLGAANADLFTHVMAFSPIAVKHPEALEGLPAVFVSHGTKDQVLPIETTTKVLLPGLKKMRVDVEFQEFDGTHAIPIEVAAHAFSWLLGTEVSAKASAPKANIKYT